VNGAAPGPVHFFLTTDHGRVHATTRIELDEVRGELRWIATVTGADEMTALVLRRRGGGTMTGPITGTATTGTLVSRVVMPDSSTRVIDRLLGPGRRTGSGARPLTAADRLAWQQGRLSVALFTTDGAHVERPIPQRR
jgi:amidase